MELRMHFGIATGLGNTILALRWTQRIPICLRHIQVNAWQDHRPVRKAGNTAQQIGHRDSRCCYTGGNQGRRRRIFAQTLLEPAQQNIPAFGRAQKLTVGKLGSVGRDNFADLPVRAEPMFGQFSHRL